jgi:hypothetical protein
MSANVICLLLALTTPKITGAHKYRAEQKIERASENKRTGRVASRSRKPREIGCDRPVKFVQVDPDQLPT